MSKDLILKLLEENKGEAISGQKLANSLGISRNAVWKSINSLKADGFEIDSSKQGYLLISHTEDVSISAIKSKVNFGLHVELHPSIDSTNSHAIRNINSLKIPSLIISLEQTAGRGRLNKSFSSQKDNGIYLTFVFENESLHENVHLVTAMSAVALVRTAKKILSEDLKIKWVNDVFRNKKKVCGILTEGITNFETSTISHIVIGMGINIDTKYLPAELKDVAGAISDMKIDKNQLISNLSNEIYKLYQGLQNSNTDFMNEYRSHSLVLGKPVKFKKFGDSLEYTGNVVSIEENGSLTIELDSGIIQNFTSGEVSIVPEFI